MSNVPRLSLGVSIVNVNWNSKVDVFEMYVVVEKNNQGAPWLPTIAKINSSNCGIGNFTILDTSGGALLAQGFPSSPNDPPIITSSPSSPVASSRFRIWRYANFAITGGFSDAARLAYFVLNIAKVKKDFPGITSIILNGSVSNSSVFFLYQVGTQYYGPSVSVSTNDVGPIGFTKTKELGADPSFTITINVANPSTNTLI